MEEALKLLSDKQLDRLIRRLQLPSTGLPLSDAKVGSKTYKGTFNGADIVRWISRELLFELDDAQTLAAHLFNLGVVNPSRPSNLKQFVCDEETLYHFREASQTKQANERVASQLMSETTTTSSTASRSTARTQLVTGLSTLSASEIRDQVQRQLFGTGEDVRAVSIVTRPKKMASALPKATSSTISSITSLDTEKELLCLTVKGENKMHIQRVKYTHGTYSIGTTWHGEDLKAVNMEESSELGFVLTFEKSFLFYAESVTDRNEFLWRLLQLCQEIMKKMPSTAIEILELRLLLESDGVKNLESGEESRFMTVEEEKQIEDLLASRVMDDARDIDRLSEELSNDVVRLETQNINDLIQSHQMIKQLWTGLGGAQARLALVATQFEGYQYIVDGSKRSFEQIEKKNNRMAIITANQNLLLTEVQNLLSKIQLDKGTLAVLTNGSFETGRALDESIRCAWKLDSALKADLRGMSKMKSVNQQIQMMLELRGVFSRRLRHFLNDLFKTLANRRLAEKKQALLSLDHFETIVKPLQSYKQLINWLKTVENDIKTNPKLAAVPLDPPDPTDTTSVSDDYTAQVHEVYRKEFKNFFGRLRKHIQREKVERLTFQTNWELKNLNPIAGMKRLGSEASQRLSNRLSKTSKDLTEDDFDDEAFDLSDDDDDDFSERSIAPTMVMTPNAAALANLFSKGKKEKVSITKAYSMALGAILPAIWTEQQYCVDFLKMSALTGLGQQKSDLDRYLENLFSDLLPFLGKLIDRSFKWDQFNLMAMWVDTKSFEDQYVDKSHFIVGLMTECRRQLETLLHGYINEQVQYVKDTKLSSKSGILDPVKKLPDFVDRLETNGASLGRAVSDIAYEKVCGAVFDWLLAFEDEEYAKLIVRTENFHFLWKQLNSRKGVVQLQKFIERAKSVHEESLSAYITLLTQRRFPTLVEFFDGVDRLLKTVPAENVQFQHSHSNQVIAKVISKWDIDSFEKQLYKLYKQTQKDLSVEEGLGPRVWVLAKDHVEGKYRHFEELIRDCYRQHALAFSSAELKDMFSRVEDKWAEKQMKKEKSY